MKILLRGISYLFQWIFTFFFALMTLGAFMDSALAGILLLLATFLVCPFTRGKLKSLIETKVPGIKGWMYGAAAGVFMIAGLGAVPSAEVP